MCTVSPSGSVIRTSRICGVSSICSSRLAMMALSFSFFGSSRAFVGSRASS